MDGQDKKGDDNPSLEQQMKNLLKKIEQEPVPAELEKLAQELQEAIRRRRASTDPRE